MRSGMGWVVALLIGSAVVWMLARAGSDQGRRRAMVVNGFEIPEAFLQLSEAIERGEAPNEWDLKEHVDAYGHPWDVFDLRLNFRDQESLQSNTDWISEAFLEEDRLQHYPDCANQPGFIAEFTGVANFVWFGSSTTGEVFAFDFGSDPKEPSVVYWDDNGYWRRVAPNFESFIALFIDSAYAPYWDLREGGGPDVLVHRTPRTLLATQARRYVLASRDSFRRFFKDVGDFYAACSPEERREVEAEVREKLERMGMTDDQRRTHEELWARLRASLPS
jgi:hypothetical protein